MARLHRAFDATRRELLDARAERQRELDAGGTLDFLPETSDVREGDWTIAPEPAALQNRRVEITGPHEPQDGHQRAELGRDRVHGGLRGLQLADLERT